MCAIKLIRQILNMDDIDQKKGHHWISNYSCSYTNNTNTILTIILEVWNTLNPLHSEVYEFNCTWKTYTFWCLKAISKLVSFVCYTFAIGVPFCNGLESEESWITLRLLFFRHKHMHFIHVVFFLKNIIICNLAELCLVSLFYENEPDFC